MTLLANGVSQDLPWSDKMDVAETLVATGRAIHPSKWVADFVAAKNAEALESLL